MHIQHADHPLLADGSTFRELMEAFERSLIREALARCRGNRTQASRKFGIPRRTLLRKIRKHGLE